MTGSQKVVADLKAALPLEANLNLSYRLYARLTHFQGIDKVSCKLEKFANHAHHFLKMVTKQLLFLTSEETNPASYTVPPINEPKPPTLTQLFLDALSAETGIATIYDRKNIPTAVAEFDEETRHLWKDLLHWHRDHQRWLEKQLHLIDVLGEADYISEKL